MTTATGLTAVLYASFAALVLLVLSVDGKTVTGARVIAKLKEKSQFDVKFTAALCPANQNGCLPSRQYTVSVSLSGLGTVDAHPELGHFDVHVNAKDPSSPDKKYLATHNSFTIDVTQSKTYVVPSDIWDTPDTLMITCYACTDAINKRIEALVEQAHKEVKQEA